MVYTGVFVGFIVIAGLIFYRLLCNPVAFLNLAPLFHSVGEYFTWKCVRRLWLVVSVSFLRYFPRLWIL